ncbi:hypothetical protein, partial [Streptomyces pseudovenezuelae]
PRTHRRIHTNLANRNGQATHIVLNIDQMLSKGSTGGAVVRTPLSSLPSMENQPSRSTMSWMMPELPL